MLLPLSINIQFGYPSFFQYSSLILSLGSYPYYIDPMQYPNITPFYFDPMTIALAIVVCSPGIYFIRWLNQQPREKSVKKMALAAAVFTSLITFPLSMIQPYNRYMPMVPYYVGSMIDSVAPWVIAVFVVLPIMGRHGSFIDSDRKAAHFSDTPEHLIHEGGIRPGRYTIMGYILGIIALCIPSIAYAYSYFDPWSTSFSLAIMTPVWAGSYSQYGIESASFYLSVMPSITVFLFYLLNIFALIFAYSILQYIQTHVDRMRVLAYAALSIIAPAAFFFFMIPFNTEVPIPVLLVLGLSIVFKLKQIPPRQTIWEDKSVKMWYEKDHEITVMGNQPPTKQVIRSEPITMVKVPFTYLLISKIRSLRSLNIKPSPKMKSNPEIDPSKADWAETEDFWASDDEE
jgi:hypothetical protein